MLRTLASLHRSKGDPTRSREGGDFWRASHTPQGPVTVRYTQHGAGARVSAWGPGAEWALAQAPALLGEGDDPTAFQTDHPVLQPLLRRFPGIRTPRSGRIMEHLVPVILGQKVTGKGASRSYRELVWRFGEAAPGPQPLRLPPPPQRLAELAYYQLHELGIERRRAQVIIAACSRHKRLEEAAGMDRDAALRRLQALPGIGPWTAAIVLRTALGDPDLVPLGDYNLPSLVSYALANERDGSDEQMLELLEPFCPHRGRVLRLLELGGNKPPKRGPRSPVRNIRGS